MKTRDKIIVLAAIGLAVFSVKLQAQPTPGNILPGTAGNSAIYYNTRSIGPSGSNVVVMNFFITTNNVDYFIVNTNTFITFLSTVLFSQTVNVAGKAQLNYLILTNGIGYYTNVWSGPSNTVDMALSSPYDLNYASFTACQLSGIAGKSNQITSEKLLSIQNLSATNFDVTLANGFTDGDFATSHTITNGTVGVFWLRYTPQPGRTNVIFRQL